MSYCLRKHVKVLFKQTHNTLENISKVIRLNSETLLPKAALSTDTSRVTSDNDSSNDAKDQNQRPHHTPVMTAEVLDMLEPKDGQIVVDMTFGGGGHSRSIVQRAGGIRLVAADRDPQAHRLAHDLSSQVTGVVPVLSRFSELPQHLSSLGLQEGTVDGFLFDLGASSMQFDTPQRGFSISADGPLDMRMDGDRFPGSPTAADVVNHLAADDLSLILKGYGEERLSRSIAQAIVEARYAFGNITRTRQLAEVVDTVFEGNHKRDKLQRHAHPATRVFQALRIFVNNELNELSNGLEVAWRYLRPQGRCVVIAFHSLEDRIVKRHFHGIEMDSQANMTLGDHHRNSAIIHSMQEVEEMLQKRWKPFSRKITTPSEEEVAANPRSRSAKLRAAVKL